MGILFVGAYFYAREVLSALLSMGHAPTIVTANDGPGWQRLDDLAWQYETDCRISTDIAIAHDVKPDLIVVAGWRRLIPPDVLALAPAIGFHSAKLPEYPGRAPVPWALIRGEDYTENTMLYLDDGPDTGDIIDSRPVRIWPGDGPAEVYRQMARTSVEMLLQHLPALLDGTAPRTPQDFTKRRHMTTKDGWAAWDELQRLSHG